MQVEELKHFEEKEDNFENNGKGDTCRYLISVFSFTKSIGYCSSFASLRSPKGSKSDSNWKIKYDNCKM